MVTFFVFIIMISNTLGEQFNEVYHDNRSTIYKIITLQWLPFVYIYQWKIVTFHYISYVK